MDEWNAIEIECPKHSDIWINVYIARNVYLSPILFCWSQAWGVTLATYPMQGLDMGNRVTTLAPFMNAS